jgi:ATP-dependent Clp protease adaptor protein ClpS
MAENPRRSAAVAEPEITPRVRRKTQRTRKPKRQPRYHVILWNDDDHSYDYVIRMMLELFHHSPAQAFEIAKTVDKSGRAICLTTTLEHAELKRDQIHAYGRDKLVRRCKGAMWSSVEAEC